MFNINFKAALNISQVFANAAIEHKIKDATIVNTSSIVRLSAYIFQSVLHIMAVL